MPARTVSLFSGLGGLDLAAHIAGLDVVAATDADADALGLLQSALGTKTITHSVEIAGTDKLISALELPEHSIDYVIGGPPCTAFSHAGFWIESKRHGKDPAAARLENYLDVVRKLRPRAFLMENVPGLAFKTHKAFFARAINRARRAGYVVSWKVMSADRFGVAQARRRLFIVGVRGGPAFKFPEGWDIARHAGWAIGDLASRDEFAEPDEVPGGQWGHLLADVPPGGNYLHFTAERGCDEPLFRYRGRYWSFLLKLDRTKPSPTVPAQRVTFNGPFHWDSRHLRTGELRRLQGFPDWYPVSSNLALARRHLGNAVPPPLGAAVLWSLRRHLDEVSIGETPPLFQCLAAKSSTVSEAMSLIHQPATILREAA